MRQIALAVAGLIGATSAHAGLPMEAYGLTFGSPLNVPECAKQGDRYELAVRDACVKWDKGDRARGGGRGRVFFPVRDKPQHSSGDSIGVFTDPESGGLELLSVPTDGPAGQQRVYAALQAKYGAPTLSEVNTMTNAYGAKFEGITASWTSPELVVRFYGVVTISTGRIAIGTPAGFDRLAATQKQAQQRGRAL